MGFWDEHEKAEAEHVAEERAKLPPSAQDAPLECLDCGALRGDVFFGVCGSCFALVPGKGR